MIITLNFLNTFFISCSLWNTLFVIFFIGHSSEFIPKKRLKLEKKQEESMSMQKVSKIVEKLCNYKLIGELSESLNKCFIFWIKDDDTVCSII